MPDRIGLGGTRSRRPLAFVLTLAVTATLVFGAALLRPSSAGAWAWKDTCTLFIFNKTGSQGNVRPILYTPVLPNAASLAEYAAFVAIGIPTSGAAVFTNTGFPVSWGCHAFMNFTSQQGTVSCKVSAPTKGANTFSCDGPATVKIIKDDDDIAGNVFIPQGSGVSGLRGPAPPRTGPGAVRRSELPGKGWKSTNTFSKLGLVGRLMNSDTLPASCHDRGGPGASPMGVRYSLDLRSGGAQGVGGGVATFANAGQARRVVADGFSPHSLSCLKRLLTSARLRTTVTTQSIPQGVLRSNDRGIQLKILRRVKGHTEADYLIVVGAVRGARAGILLIESAGKPLRAGESLAAVKALRIGG